MIITEIQIIPIKPFNGLVGFASIVINNEVYLGSIGIYTRPESGYRLTYPTKQVNNRQINIFHPINKESGYEIEKAVINKFEEVMNKYDRYSPINT